MQNYICFNCLFFAGFDFDLDEVWAPLNPHLRGALCKSGSAGSHSEGSSSSCSDSSIHTGYLGLKQPQRPPMQSVVFGDSSEDSRVPTARLSGRGCPAGGRLSQQEVCVLCSMYVRMFKIAHSNIFGVDSKGQLISKCLFGVFNFFQK